MVSVSDQYKKLPNTDDQSNRTILVTFIGASFWYKFLEHVSPIVQSREIRVQSTNTSPFLLLYSRSKTVQSDWLSDCL